jgi:hypothetical protein
VRQALCDVSGNGRQLLIPIRSAKGNVWFKASLGETMSSTLEMDIGDARAAMLRSTDDPHWSAIRR